MKTESKTKLFSFRLPEVIRKRIEKFRYEKLAIPLSSLIVQAIDEYLEQRGY